MRMRQLVSILTKLLTKNFRQMFYKFDLFVASADKKKVYSKLEIFFSMQLIDQPSLLSPQ